MGPNICHGCSTWFGDDRTKVNLGRFLLDDGLTPTQNYRDMVQNDRDAASMARGEVARSNKGKGCCCIASCDATKQNGKHDGETLRGESIEFLERIARECKQACEQYYNAQQEAKRKAMAMKNLKAYISKLQEMRCTDLHK